MTGDFVAPSARWPRSKLAAIDESQLRSAFFARSHMAFWIDIKALEVRDVHPCLAEIRRFVKNKGLSRNDEV